MRDRDNEGQQATPEQGWASIHATLDRSRSSMYVAGWAHIMLLWGAIVTVGYLSTYAIESLAPAFASDYPWYPGLLWIRLVVPGVIGSSIIGHRASKRNASGPSATAAGMRVFSFWMSVVAAAFVIPAASGLWSADSDPIAVTGVAVGIVALGYILFGIMHSLAVTLVGLGIAASYYLPAHYAGDSAPLMTSALILAVVVVAWIWVRKSATA